MKTKKLYISIIFTLFLALSLFFVSCSNDSEAELPSSEQSNKLEGVDNMEYLDLNTTKISKMSKMDLNILFKAIERLDISKKDGFYIIKETSGDQVNISKHLFDYINESYQNTNNIFKIKKKKKLTARLISGDPENGDPQSDCVAYAVANMGADSSFRKINKYITSTYGSDGVPSKYLGSIVLNFCPNASFSMSTPPNGSIDNALIWFTTPDGIAHAVNAQHYYSESGVLAYYDHQNNETGFVNSSDVKGYFYCNN